MPLSAARAAPSAPAGGRVAWRVGSPAVPRAVSPVGWQAVLQGASLVDGQAVWQVGSLVAPWAVSLVGWQAALRASAQDPVQEVALWACPSSGGTPAVEL